MNQPVPARTVWGLVGLGFLFRLIAAWLAEIPAEDGVNYLWMAERFAEGDATGALSEVFPPLLSLLIVPFLWLGLPAFLAGQVLTAIAGALSIYLVIRLVERIKPDAALFAGLFMTVAHLAIRLGAKVYSEPVFLLVSALALDLGLRKRYAMAGLVAGVAFWARPEAALIPIAFVVFDLRRASRGLITFGLLVLALGAWRDAVGLGFVLEAKTALHNQRLWGDSFSVLGFIEHFFANTVQIPRLWLEAYGLIGVLALIGLWKGGGRELRSFWLLLVLGVIVICQFLPRRRFLMTWFVALLPFAALGLSALPVSMRSVTLYTVLLVTLAMAFKPPDADKVFERYMGTSLGKLMQPSDRIVSDFTRLIYFAGRRPNAPRHYSADELIELALQPGVRFVVLGTRRPTAVVVTQALSDHFAKFPLSPEQAEWCDRRGMQVLSR